MLAELALQRPLFPCHSPAQLLQQASALNPCLSLPRRPLAIHMHTHCMPCSQACLPVINPCLLCTCCFNSAYTTMIASCLYLAAVVPSGGEQSVCIFVQEASFTPLFDTSVSDGGAPGPAAATAPAWLLPAQHVRAVGGERRRRRRSLIRRQMSVQRTARSLQLQRAAAAGTGCGRAAVPLERPGTSGSAP